MPEVMSKQRRSGGQGRYGFGPGLALALMLGAAGLTGCQNVTEEFGKKFGNDDSSSSESSQTGDTDISPEDLPGERLLASFEPIAKTDYASLDAARGETLRLYRGQGNGFMGIDAVDAYVNEVLDRIIAVSPQPDIAVQAYVLDNGEPEALATADGAIVVSHGMLDELETEDQLAALLAHELAHVLYQHPEDDWWIEAQKQLIAVQSLVSDAWASAEADHVPADKQSDSEKKRRELDEITLMSEAAQFVSETVIAPAYTRDQEDAADLMAIDLLEKADYYPNAMFELVCTLSAMNIGRAKAEREIQARLSKHLTTYGTEKLGLTQDSAFTASLAEGVGDATKFVLKTWDDMFGDSHRPGPEREAFVQAYLTKHGLAPRGRPPVQTRTPWNGGAPAFADFATIRTVFDHYAAAGKAREAIEDGALSRAVPLARRGVSGPTKYAPRPRITFYKLRDKQRRDDKAWANLDIALEAPETGVTFYREAIRRAAHGAGDMKKALKYAEHAKTEGGDPPALWPWRIFLYKRTDQPEKALALTLRCRTKYPGGLEQACRVGPNLEQEAAK